MRRSRRASGGSQVPPQRNSRMTALYYLLLLRKLLLSPRQVPQTRVSAELLRAYALEFRTCAVYYIVTMSLVCDLAVSWLAVVAVSFWNFKW